LTLWLVNVGFGTLVGTNYLAHVPQVDSLRLWCFALLALVSSVVLLTLVPGGFFVGAAHVVQSTRTLGIVQAAFWTVFQVLLYADTRIYNIFRYHLNGQVWNLVYTRGSEDAIHLGWQVWLTVAVGLGGMGLIEAWIWRWALRRAEAQRAIPRLRPTFVWLAVLLPAVFLDKTIYAQADLARDRQVTALARLFPLYTRVPMEDLASRVLGVDVEKPPRVEIDGYDLRYPLAYPDVPADGPRPNFLVLVVDCLRRDMLAPGSTPRTWAWSQEPGCRRFADHVSGGNSTRYGIFSLLYGLHGSYWFSFLEARRSPVLVDVLLDQGYEFGVFSSATMNYPELRATAWSRIPDRVFDAFPGEAWHRDELAGEALVEWLRERESEPEPFFGFLLLDSPHQTYSHPPGEEPFRPSAEEVNYMAMTENDGPDPVELERVRNRYKNAVYHSDAVLGRVFEFLESSELAEDTVVVVTGDHGEEFLECGFYGHTSAFTPEQVSVPFLARGPGIPPGVEERPTSHHDFAPTLLELLGAPASERASWTLGESLLDPPARRSRVISGWNELGMWTDSGILRVPLSLLEFEIEVYDYRWNLVLDDRRVLDAEAEALAHLGAECSRFLR